MSVSGYMCGWVGVSVCVCRCEGVCVCVCVCVCLCVCREGGVEAMYGKLMSIGVFGCK